MTVFNFLTDSLVNFVSGLGTGRDKSASAQYVATPAKTNQELLAFYRSSWLAKKVVQIPAFDSFRKWRNWQASSDEITLLEAEEKRLFFKQKLYEARWKARLFGWCAVYISDGTSNPELPLNPERIAKNGIKFLNVMPSWHFVHDNLDWDKDPESATFGQPLFYRTSPQSTANGIMLPEIRIHPSRLVIFKGDPSPDNGEIGGVGLSQTFMQGESVLEGRYTAILNADSAAANVASLIYEAKTDIVRIPNLMENLRSSAYAERLMTRFTLAERGKGINGTLMLDKEEEYTQKNVSLTGLDSLIDRFMQLSAGASDIPVTRLLGVSPGGLNATGEHDLRNYYDFVQALQENEITPAILTLDECLIRSALGSRPAEVHYVWASLWQVSDKERADIGKIGSGIIKELADTGLYPQEALANAGANFMVENSVLPGFTDMIDEAGGLPDYSFDTPSDKPKDEQPQEQQVFDATPKTLYVCRYVKNYSAIVAHYRRQGITIENPSKLHVTVLHSSRPIDWFSVGEAWQAEIKLDGGARDHEEFGVEGKPKHLVLLIKSNELEWRHQVFIDKGASHDFEDYQPHITILPKVEQMPDLSTIEPYRGEIVLGAEMFEEIR